MKTYYLSLVRGLIGYFVKFEAESEEAVRNHATKYFGKLWCEVYTEAYFREILRKRYPNATRVINRDRPIKLTTETGEWE